MTSTPRSTPLPRSPSLPSSLSSSSGPRLVSSTSASTRSPRPRSRAASPRTLPPSPAASSSSLPSSPPLLSTLSVAPSSVTSRSRPTTWSLMSSTASGCPIPCTPTLPRGGSFARRSPTSALVSASLCMASSTSLPGPAFLLPPSRLCSLFALASTLSASATEPSRPSSTRTSPRARPRLTTPSRRSAPSPSFSLVSTWLSLPSPSSSPAASTTLATLSATLPPMTSPPPLSLARPRMLV
eukprot:Amastigsp_a841091_7993.p3 type:complete len:240 gc:universal Amastigsp_a841091_7993:1000-1719(+)